ncbi:hypothetical protein PUN28_003334 [Cardiocondyla obscurior]|uniref:Uncharacterized protein n=1 Tax=Cardiocondyla obscurior TaxID=286306 RepID=A0AAW2GLS3_9HYME
MGRVTTSGGFVPNRFLAARDCRAAGCCVTWEGQQISKLLFRIRDFNSFLPTWTADARLTEPSRGSSLVVWSHAERQCRFY